LLLAACATVGCGKAVGDVTGKVTYQNKALPFGWVKLHGSDGLFREAKIEAGGTYRFTGVPVGEAKFMVSCIDPKIEQFMQGLIARQRGGDGKAPRVQVPAQSEEEMFAKFYLIPREYEDFTKSKLVFQVQRGENTIDLDLK
jgi:hypothetical protein